MAKFSKKHYEVIADHIRMGKINADREHGETGWPKFDALNQLAKELCFSFQVDNPAFDADRFMEACGFQERAR